MQRDSAHINCFDKLGRRVGRWLPGGQSEGFVYNADNQLTNVVNGATTIALVYNADGHRIRKTVTTGGNTTNTLYVVDDQNPTGYAQVLEERITGGMNATVYYRYGLDLISQLVSSGGETTNYFGYDGHGSVRFLTGSGTNVTVHVRRLRHAQPMQRQWQSMTLTSLATNCATRSASKRAVTVLSEVKIG